MWKERHESGKAPAHAGSGSGSGSSSPPPTPPPAAAQLLGAGQRDRTVLPQDLALLDEADIWLAGEVLKPVS